MPDLTLDYSISELKTIYCVLHAALPENPELMDSGFLEDLQRCLQKQAAKEGVDVSLHAQWAAWLGYNGKLQGP